MAQRVGRGIALLLHDRGTRRRASGQKHAPAAVYPRERPGTHFTGGWLGPRASLSPITGPWYPEGSRKLRFPDYMTMAQDGGKVVSLTPRASLERRKISSLPRFDPGPSSP